MAVAYDIHTPLSSTTGGVKPLSMARVEQGMDGAADDNRDG